MDESREARIKRLTPRWEAKRLLCDLRDRLQEAEHESRERPDYEAANRLQAARDQFERAVHIAVETDANGNGIALLQCPDGRLVRAKVSKFSGRMWQ